MFQENPIINWDAIWWVNRPVYLWTVQVILAMISLTQALLLAYLGYKVRVACRVSRFACRVSRVACRAWSRVAPGRAWSRLVARTSTSCKCKYSVLSVLSRAR